MRKLSKNGVVKNETTGLRILPTPVLHSGNAAVAGLIGDNRSHYSLYSQQGTSWQSPSKPKNKSP
jgi:hypothetical protein